MKNRAKIELKKTVDSFYVDEDMQIKDCQIYVQIAQDKRGTTISLDDKTVSLSRLGYRLVRDI